LAPQVALQKTVQFTGFAVGLQAPDLFWSIDSDALGSTIDHTTGLFTAGQTIGTVVVRGSSITEPARFKKTTVTIVDSCNGTTAALFDNRLRFGPFVDDDEPPVCIVVDPPVTTVMASHKQQFTAIVTGGTNQQVDWSVTGRSQITSDGLLTAGPTAGTVTVRAQSVVDPSVFGEATVTIVPQPPPDPTFVPSLQGHYRGGASFPFIAGGVPDNIVQDCSTRGGVVMMQATFDYHSDTGLLTGSFPIDNSTVHFTQYTFNTIIMTLGGAPAFCGEITIAGIVVRARYLLETVSIGMSWVGP
jgi:hypothetical protein